MSTNLSTTSLKIGEQSLSHCQMLVDSHGLLSVNLSILFDCHDQVNR